MTLYADAIAFSLPRQSIRMSSGVSTMSSDRTRDEHVSQAIVEAVADAEDVDPTELEIPLYAAVDPDALDALFRPGNHGVVRMQFSYHGYRITVHGDGQLHLERP